jgi:4-hydroxy-tetrahydrodipicolinate synthase
MNLPVRGLITPLATPLAANTQAEPVLDDLAFEGLIDHVIAGGVSGLFLLGSTGEFPSLGREMRQEIIRRGCRHADRRVPVMVAVTDTAFSETMRLADTAVEAGADALVLAPPYYFEHSQDDLFCYVEKITERISLPLFLYNIPHLTKTTFHPETVRRMADLPHVIGLKDSTGDVKYLDKTLELTRDRPDFSILIGPEEMLLECMKRGAHGGVCGGSNLKPTLLVALYDAIVRGDWEAAEALQESVQHMNRALYRTGSPGGSYLRGIKAALSFAGLCRPEPALPFMPFSEAEYAEVEAGFRSL